MERKQFIYSSPKRDKYLKTVLSLYRSGMPVRKISDKTDVSVAHIYRWISKFADRIQVPENGPVANQAKEEMDKPKSINIEELSNLAPEEQIAKLKEALRMAELRADLYNEIINVAETKFKIDIRKKAGAKQ